ncbi:MAG TPA: gliding motility-associated C-terminal domain-containing protein [Cytophagaceae bacterium]
MRQDADIYQLIDDYLDDKLSEEANRDFEHMMSIDSELKEEVFYRKLGKELVVEERYYEIAKSIRNTPIPPQGIQKYASLKKWSGYISAAVIATLAVVFFLKDKEPKEEEVTITSESIAEPEIIINEEIANTNIIEEEVVTDPAPNPGVTQNTEKVVSIKNDDTPQKEVNQALDSSYLIEIPVDNITELSQAQSAKSFHPAKGELWAIPVESGKTGKLRIFDKTGKEVYTADVSYEKTNQWDGRATDGTNLGSGNYTYLIDYGSGDTQHGIITIVD